MIRVEQSGYVGRRNIESKLWDCRIKKFVYASSSSVYGDHPELPKKEGKEGNVLSPYALTKLVNEECGKIYFKWEKL